MLEGFGTSNIGIIRTIDPTSVKEDTMDKIDIWMEFKLLEPSIKVQDTDVGSRNVGLPVKYVVQYGLIQAELAN